MGRFPYKGIGEFPICNDVRGVDSHIRQEGTLKIVEKRKKKDVKKGLTTAAKDLGEKIIEPLKEAPKGKRYLTFDVSTNATGWSVWRLEEDWSATYEKGGSIRPKGKNAPERFPGMASGIVSIISDTVPDFIVSEQMFIRQSFDSIEYPLKLHGIEEYAASIAGIPDYPIVTSTWRSMCGFPSNLDIGKMKSPMSKKEKDAYYKKLSIAFAGNVPDCIPEDDNHADATCIGFAVAKIIQACIKNN